MKHDPGGKTRLQMLPGVRGWAKFSDCERYRHSLAREWGPGQYVLWIGMNPSTATEKVDDPTIRREIYFTQREGYNSYRKANVMDYRATDPKELFRLPAGVWRCSQENLPAISELANEAALVVAAWGTLPNPLRAYAKQVVLLMKNLKVKLWCLGTTQDGSPRHPLYVKSDTRLIRWKP